ncbi:MAG TPA: hypothetical protein VIS48_07630 [Candidatus Kryptonia bacterium]
MDRDTFIDFYSDMSDEDPEYIRRYLADQGIDVDAFQNMLLEIVARYRAELAAMEERGCTLTPEELRQRLLSKGDFAKQASQEDTGNKTPNAIQEVKSVPKGLCAKKKNPHNHPVEPV